MRADEEELAAEVDDAGAKLAEQVASHVGVGMASPQVEELDYAPPATPCICVSAEYTLAGLFTAGLVRPTGSPNEVSMASVATGCAVTWLCDGFALYVGLWPHMSVVFAFLYSIGKMR